MTRLSQTCTSIVPLLLGAFLLIGLTACSSTESATEAAAPVAERPAWDLGDGTYMLRLAPETASAYRVTQQQMSDMNMVVAGNEIDVTQNQTITQRMHIADYTADGITVIENTIERIQAEGGSMGQTASYDSDAEDEASPLAAQFDPMIAQTLRLELSPSGAFVGDRDTLEAQIASMMGGAEDNAMVSADMLIDPILSQFQFYPEDPMSVGDSWTADTEMNVGIPFSVVSVYTLTSVDDGLATLDVTIEMDSEGAPMELGPGATAEAFLTGSQTGTMTVDLQSGLMMTYEQGGSISGFAEFTAPGQNEVMEIDMAIDSENTYRVERITDAAASE